LTEFDKAKMYKDRGNKAAKDGKFEEAKINYLESIKYLTILRNRTNPPMSDNYQMMIDIVKNFIIKLEDKKKKIYKQPEKPYKDKIKIPDNLPEHCKEKIIITNRTFDDIAGLDELKATLRKTIEYPLKYPEKVKKWGFEGEKGILMHGPPGCGKTYLIECTGGEFGVPIISLDPADVMNKYVGESSKAIKETYKCANFLAPAIVFLDEIERLLFSGDSSGVNAQVTSQLMQQLSGVIGLSTTSENSPIITIAASNHPWKIDPALIRRGRLGKIVYVPPPDKKARVRLFEIHIKNFPYEKTIDFDKLAELTSEDKSSGWQYSSSDISDICKNARDEALELDKDGHSDVKITEEMLLKHLKNTKRTISPKQIKDYLEWENRSNNSM